MFTEFQQMIKKQAEKITKSVPLDLLSQQEQNDYSKTPQKYTISHHQIEQKKLLAQGAFGFIWLAEDSQTRQQYALKRVIAMTPQKCKSAILQKSIMQKLPKSPHIVQYHGSTILSHNDSKVIVTLMQYCPNGTLFDLLEKRQNKGIPEETLKTIARSVLSGLIVLHRAGIIHRDIKIENVLIGADGKMKICDFGSCTSSVVDFGKIDKGEYEHVKEGIEAMTTPMYRPPEIVDPYLRYKVCEKVDLWMLGCVMYTMAYFVHPFLDANAVGIASGTFRFPADNQTPYKVSQKMKDFIRNLLTPNPQFRPSAQKMLQILNKWEDLSSIPLNQDAKRLKKQHLQKQQQLKKLNQKVSKHDGDIPLQQLMKLGEKLKSTNRENYQKQKISFISDKQTLAISKGQPSLPNFSLPSSSSSSSSNKPPPPPIPSTSTSASIPTSTPTSYTKKPSGQSVAKPPIRIEAKNSINNNNNYSNNGGKIGNDFDVFNDVFGGMDKDKGSGNGNASGSGGNAGDFAGFANVSSNKNNNGNKNNDNFYEFFESYANSSNSSNLNSSINTNTTANKTSSSNNISSVKKQMNLLDL